MDKLTVAEKIRLLLGRQGLTITKLAAAMGISRQYLTAKMKDNKFSVAELEKIASILGCDIDFIFTTGAGEKI